MKCHDFRLAWGCPVGFGLSKSGWGEYGGRLLMP